MKRKRGGNGRNGKNRTPITDKRLIPRVRAYVISLSDPPPPYVDVDEVTAHLRQTYPRDYTRSQRAPFTKVVLHALDAVLKDVHPPVPLPEDPPEPEDIAPPNALASSMSSILRAHASPAPKEGGGGEGGEGASGGGGGSGSGKRKRKRRISAISGSGRMVVEEGKGKEEVGGGGDDGGADDDDDNGVVGGKRHHGLAMNDDGKIVSAFSGADFVVEPSGSFNDVGGLDEAVVELRLTLAAAIRHPEVYEAIGTGPTRGILLHGPPGTGKTLLANALAAELGVPFLRISAPEIVTSYSGDSEAKVRQLFDAAVVRAPCIVFMDEIDAIAPARSSTSRDMERRIVAQLLTCMDDMSLEKTGGKPVVVIAATNRPHAIDPALRRGGRFDREIALGIPTEPARRSILSVLVRNLKLGADVDVGAIAASSPGYVGADLASLCKEAASLAITRAFEELFLPGTAAPMEVEGKASASGSRGQSGARGVYSRAAEAEERMEKNKALVSALEAREEPLESSELEGIAIHQVDFEAALKVVQPSSKREGFATVPDVSWEDVGALEDVRSELNDAIVHPIKYPELHEAMGLSTPAGVLLYGPPGCGKTLLAKAIASSSNASFISIKGPELLNKYVGESERAVRQVFQRGRASAPCVIFFDELDALCPKRDGESNASGQRLVNQLLTEMDGLSSRGQVYIIGATNRPSIIDDAIMRPGRLEKLVYVPLPKPSDRVAILKTLVRHTPLDPEGSVDLEGIALDERASGFSGADLAALVRQAATNALRARFASASGVSGGAGGGAASSASGSGKLEVSREPIYVMGSHFNAAFDVVLPSVSSSVSSRYESLSLRSR